MRKKLYADSWFDTEELVWGDGYTDRKLIKSLAHLKMRFVNKAPWVIMIDNDAYKIEDNSSAIRVICDLNERQSKLDLMNRLNNLLKALAEGKLTIDCKQWHLRPDDKDKIEPPCKRMKV
jgi:hypothetical protein